MNILSIYLILLLTQVSIYFYFKNNIENIKFYKYSVFANPTQNEVLDKKEMPQVEKFKPVNLTNKIEDNNYAILNKSLRHLEFISQFEMYLEDKNYKMFPIEFLQEFEKIKLEAQITTLKTTNRLNTIHKNAA